MSARSVPVFRKSLREFSNPVWLGVFLLVYAGVCVLVGIGVTQGMPEELGSLPLHVQEQELLAAFGQLAFVWAVGIPMMVLTAVLAASSIATEAERGTLQILLSKPIRRWEVLLGKFAAIFLFSLLAMLAGLSFAATVVYAFSGAAAAAIGGSILHLAAGNVAYALFVAVVVASVGTFVAVVTGSRLRTALATLVVPVLFFAFIFIRIIPTSGMYEDYYLYLLDVSYHFGNAFVFVHEATGTEFSPAAQSVIATTTGVYDTTGTGVDPLVGGMVSTVPLTGYVPPIASVVVLLGGSLALLGVGIYHFQRTDVD